MSDLARWAEEHKDEMTPFQPVNELGWTDQCKYYSSSVRRNIKMKVTLDYLQEASKQMAEAKVEPLPVYIVIIGDKKFMCPVSSWPECIAPLPCEIVGTKFPVDAGGTTHNNSSPYGLNMQYRTNRKAEHETQEDDGEI